MMGDLVFRRPAADEETAAENAAAYTVWLEKVYDQCGHRVLNFMRYRAGHEQEARDLTQTVFEKVIRAGRSFDEKKGSLEVWVFTIARNVLKDHYRQKSRQSPTLPLPPDESGEAMAGGHGCDPQAEAERAEDAARLFAAMETLTARERSVVALRFGSGLKNTEIARVMGLTARNVGVILHRSLKKMQTELEETP